MADRYGRFYDENLNIWIIPNCKGELHEPRYYGIRESKPVVKYYGWSNRKNNVPGEKLISYYVPYSPLNTCFLCHRLSGRKFVNSKIVQTIRGLEKVTKEKYAIPDYFRGDMCMKCYWQLTRFKNVCEQLFLLKKEIRQCKSKTRQTSENSYVPRLLA